jgi:hypothetical protein
MIGHLLHVHLARASRSLRANALLIPAVTALRDAIAAR